MIFKTTLLYQEEYSNKIQNTCQ